MFKMSKRLKLGLSFPSLQFCRPKQLPHAPSAYPFSWVDPNSLNLSFTNVPQPPPSTPNHSISKRHVSPNIEPLNATSPPQKEHRQSARHVSPKITPLNARSPPVKKSRVEEQSKPRRPVKAALLGERRSAEEGFAVVKRSADPYEDFKRSMLEMVLEMQMFDAEGLEELLLCFLSLNSRHHHAVIVTAFAEVWEILFCVNGRE